ncbi:MAG: hypothetical protein IJO46_13440, partial [Thermoguttaceae bacterium]|nr:hypothetical protein [Thermoguttaceae bacterium]
VALLTGGAAALGVKSIFFVESDEGVEEVAVAVGTETQVLVANVDIPAGVELTAQNVRLTLTPESEIPREERPLTFSEAVGALTVRDLKAGEPISLFDVAAPENLTASEEIYVKPGYAIVPIEIQTATKAGGGRDFLKTTKLDKMLKPGDVVDLAVVKEDKSVSSSTLGSVPRRRLTTETIVEGAEVFSVSDSSRFSQETGAAQRVATVCVQLSKEQLAAALKAAEQGRVKIVPRVEEADFGGDADAPLALDGNLGGAFEPPMNADFSFSGLTDETTGAASDWEIAVDETPRETNGGENESTDLAQEETTDELVPFEIAVEDETPEVAPETGLSPESNPTPDALVPFEIAVEDETAETEDDAKEEAPFRLRNASVRSESVDDEEEEGESADETPNDAAAPIAPIAEPRQANVAPSSNAPTYRESAVETNVADEASGEPAPRAERTFKYVSPFVTVNKKKAASNPAPTGRWGANAR